MATYYYGEGGNNSNNGSSYALRKATHENFRSSLTSGDIVYICAAASGLANRWRCSEQIRPVSGVTYHVYPNHWILMDVVTSSNQGALEAVGVSNMTFEPAQGHIQFGDWELDWEPYVNAGDGNWYSYSARRQLNFSNCSNIRLIGNGTGIPGDPDSNFTVHGGRAYEANMFDSSCNLILIEGIDMNRHGTNNTKDLFDYPEQDDGDLIAYNGTRAIFKRCRMALGGHQNLAQRGRWVVVTECDFDGSYEGVTDNADAGRGAPIERSGMRALALVCADDDHGATSPYGPALVEHNTIRNAGSAADEHNNPNLKVDGFHVICRGNYILDGCDSAITTATHDDFADNSLGAIKVYHNTLYGNGRIMDIRTDPNNVFANQYHYCDFLNNVCDEMAGAYFQGSDNEQFRRNAAGESLDGFANIWKGGRYNGNLAKMSASAPEGSTVTVEYRATNGVYTDYTWTNVDEAYPSNWGPNNVVGSPTYAGSPSTGQRTRAAFAPAGGLETGNAVGVCITANSGTASTNLQVTAGGGYSFHDDWGMSSLGFEADYIQIGDSGTPVQISSANPSGHSYILSEARTWSSGDPVYWCTTQDGINFTVYRDIGAGQSSTNINPDPFQPVYSSTVFVWR